MTQRGRTSPSTTHGFWRIAPSAMMPTSPGLMIGVPASTPKTPMFVIVIVPPCWSAGVRLALARRQRELLEGAGEVAGVELLRVLDVRHEEAAGRRGGDAEVHVVAHADLRALVGLDPRGVDHRRPPHGPDDRPRHDQQRRDLGVGEVGRGLEPLDELHRARRVDVDPHRHVRGRVGARGHRRGGGLAHAADRDRLLAVIRRRGGGAGDGDRLLAHGVPLRRLDVAEHRRLRRLLHDVVARDLAGGAAGHDRPEVHAEIARQLADRRLRDDTDRMPQPAARAGLRLREFTVPAAAVADEHRAARVGGGLRCLRRDGRRRPLGGDRDDRRADLDGVALRRQQLADDAFERGRQLDERLRRLDLDDARR